MFIAALLTIAGTWTQPKSLYRWMDTEAVAQYTMEGFPGSSAGEESTCNPGDTDSIPELGEEIGYLP